MQRGAGCDEIADRYGGRFRESLIEESVCIFPPADGCQRTASLPARLIAAQRTASLPLAYGARPHSPRRAAIAARSRTTLEARHLSKTISLPFSADKPMRHFLTLEI
jgi:hypothetical protein